MCISYSILDLWVGGSKRQNHPMRTQNFKEKGNINCLMCHLQLLFVAISISIDMNRPLRPTCIL